MKCNMIIVLLMVVATGCSSLSKATKELSPREEYYLGRSVVANVFSNSKLLDTPFNKYLNEVGQLLALYSERPYTFKGYKFGVIDEKQPMALSSPAGHVLVSKGLIQSINTEDELAAVLAHEIAHVGKRHALESIQKSGISEMATGGALALIAFFTKQQELSKAIDHYDELVGDYAEQIINGKYNKDQEHEADEVAIITLRKAGYDPLALHRYLAGLKTQAGGWMSNHPSDDDRVEEVAEMLKKLSKTKLSAKRTKRFLREKKRL